MKKNILTIIFLLPLLAFSQENKAKTILDMLSKKTKTYTTIEAHFINSFTSIEAGVNEHQNGKLFLKNNSYRLELENQNIMSDGETNWFILNDDQEVNITEADEEEGFSPSSIFTIYENGYKYKFIKEENNKYYIELFPKEEGMFSKLIMVINKTKMEIEELSMVDKNNSIYTYKISKFIKNHELPNDYFIFNTNKYADYDIIDLR